MTDGKNILGWLGGATAGVVDYFHGNSIVAFIPALDWQSMLAVGVNAGIAGIVGYTVETALKHLYKRISKK